MSTSEILLISENEKASVPHTSSLPSFISLVGLRAPKFIPDEVRARAGMDIVAVLDRSGSMAGEKMTMMHTTVNLMIDHLSEDDRLSLVAYDDNVEVATPLTKMTKEGKQLSRAALSQIKDRGSTNLSGGLFQGLQVLKDRTEGKNEISSVLLLTDGLANVGITDPSQLVSQTTSLLASMNNPTSVYCFGFGSDHNSQLLTSLAVAGHGTYYFMKNTDSVPPAFADCLGGLMSVIAQNIKLTITASEGVTINKVNCAFPITEDAPHSFTIAIGDLFSEEERDVLIDLAIPATANPDPAHLVLECSLKYLNVLSASTQTTLLQVTLPRTASDSPIGAGSSKVDQQRNRLETTHALEEARRLGEQNQLPEAQKLVEDMRAKIQASPAAELCQDLVQDLTSVLGTMQSRQQFQAEGAHRMMNKARKHGMQRACESDMMEAQSYATDAKMAMRGNWGYK